MPFDKKGNWVAYKSLVGQPAQPSSDFNLIDVAGSLINGFVQGFTTLNVGEPPKNTWDKIAHSVGFLAGFVGFIPGLGALGELATKATIETTGIGVKAATILGRASEMKSIPMLVSDIIMKGGEKVGIGDAAKLATGFLEKQGFTHGATLLDVMEQGAHLAIANGVSTATINPGNWQANADAMFGSMIQGGIAGGVFGALGNLLPSKIPADADLYTRIKGLVQDLRPGSPTYGKVDPTGAIRLMASAVFTGLPSTLKKDPLELQVYQYLLGSYFGITSGSLQDRTILKTMNDLVKEKTEGISNPTSHLVDAALHNYKDSKAFNSLSSEDKKAFEAQMDFRGLKLYGLGKQGAQFTLGGKFIAEAKFDAISKQLEQISKDFADGKIDSDGYQLATLSLYKQFQGVEIVQAIEKERELVEKNKSNPWNKLSVSNREAKIFHKVLEERGIQAEEKMKLDEQHFQSKQEEDTFKTAMNLSLTSKDLVKMQQSVLEVKETAPAFSPTFSKIIIDIYKSNEKATPDEIIKNQAKASNIITDSVKEGWNYNKLVDEIKDKFSGLKLSEGSPLERALRRSYVAQKDLVNIPMLRISKGSEGYLVEDAGVEDIHHNLIAQFKSKHFIIETMKKIDKDFKFYNLKKVWNFNKDGKPTKEISINEAGLSPEDITNIVYKSKNMGVYLGIKDNANLAVVSFVDGAKNIYEAKATLERMKKWALTTNNSKSILNEIQALHDRFVLETNIGDSKSASNVWLQNFTNNWLLHSHLNSMKLEDYLDHVSNDPNFLNKARQIVKRASLLNNGFFRWDEKYFKDIKDSNGNINLIIHRAFPKDNTTIYGKVDKKYYNQFIKEQKFDADLDGYIILRKDIYDALTSLAGFEKNTGAQKGTLVHTSDGKGLLLGKYAYFKATDDMNKELIANKAHAIANDTAIKQVGNRHVFDVQWNQNNPEGKRLVFLSTKDNPITEEDIQKLITRIPIRDFTYSDAGEHLHSQLKDAPYLSQLLSVPDKKRGKKLRNFLKLESQRAFLGDEAENNKLASALINDPTVDVNSIDFNKVGVNQLLKVVYSGIDSPVYRKLIHYFLNNETSDYYHPILFSQEEQNRLSLNTSTQTIEQLYKLWDMTPALVNSNLIAPYLNQVLLNNIINRVIQPTAKGSFIAIFNPDVYDIKAKNNLKKGEVLLGNALKDYKIPWNNKEGFLEIEKALEEYHNALKNRNKYSLESIKRMKNDLQIIIQRPPTDSFAGIRAVHIRGFSGYDGSGIVVHPEDMMAMGGADNDIDKMYVYTQIPQDVKDEINQPAVKDMWKKKIKVNGKQIYAFQIPKSGDLFLDKNKTSQKFLVRQSDGKKFIPQEDFLNYTMAMGDPGIIGFINRSSTEGSNLLAPGIYESKILEAYIDTLSPQEQKKLHIQDFYKAKYTLINRAADAADGVSLVDSKEAIHIMRKSLFGDEKSIEEHIKTKEYKSLRKLESLSHKKLTITGKDNNYFTKDIKSLGELSKLIKRYSGVFDKRGISVLDNPYYINVSRLKNIYNYAKPYSFLSRNFSIEFDRMEKALKENKELTFLLGANPNDKKVNLKFFNDARKSDAYKEAVSKSKLDGVGFLNELLGQSIFDLSTSLEMIKYAPKDYDKRVIIKILQTVKEQKRILREGIESGKKAKATGGQSRVLQNIDKVDQMRKDFLDALPEEYHNYYHAATLSTRSYHEETLQELIKKRVATINDIKIKRLNQVKILEEKGKITPPLAREKEAQILEDTKNLLENAEISARKDWYATNMSENVFRLKTIPDEIKASIGKRYNDVAQKLNSHLSQEDLNRLWEYTDNSLITDDNYFPDYMKITDLLKTHYEKIAKQEVNLKNVSPELLKKLNKAKEDLTKFLVSDPELALDLEASFYGSTLKLNGDTMVGVSPLSATPEDFIKFVNDVKIRKETKGKPYDFKMRHWYMNLPRVINKTKNYDPINLWNKLPVIQDGKIKMAEVKLTTSTMELMHQTSNKGQIQKEAIQSKYENELEKSIAFKITDHLNNIENGLGDKLYQYAIAVLREANFGKISKEKIRIAKEKEAEKSLTEKNVSPSIKLNKTNTYLENKEKYLKELAPYLNNSKTYQLPFFDRPYTFKQLGKILNDDITDWNKKVLSTLVSNTQKVNRFLTSPRPPGEELIDKWGYLNIDNIRKALMQEWVLGKPNLYSLELLDRIAHQYKLEGIKLQPLSYFLFLARRMGIMERSIPKEYKTYKEYEKAFIEKNNLLNVKGRLEFIDKKLSIGTQSPGFKYMRKLIELDKEEKIEDVKDREIRADLLDTFKHSGYNVHNWLEFKPLGQKLPGWLSQFYFPHILYERGALKKDLFRRLKLAAEGDGAEAQTLKALAGIKDESLYNSELGKPESAQMTEAYEDLLEPQEITEKNMTTINPVFGNLLHRDEENPTKGWLLSPKQQILYQEKAIRVYYDSLISFLNRGYIRDLRTNKSFGKNTETWAKYLYIYNRNQIGRPSLFPTAWRNDPALKLKYNPYILITDDYWNRKAKDINKKIGGKLYKDFPSLTPSQRELIADPKNLSTLKTVYANDVSTKLSLLSQLEGKFELMSLLLHPKVWINNMVGGNLNTYESVGYTHFKHAMDINWLKKNVFLDFHSKTDILKFVEESGGMESFYSSQFGLNPLFKAGKFRDLAKDFTNNLRKAATDRVPIKNLLDKHGIGEDFLKTAGWFMRDSEVRLRSRAWMAHYLNAREIFNASGLILEKDHPWLINMANKGVETTQFLYNNANRAPFAQTALGKIMTRFQLWAWNSLQFRREIIGYAHSVNYNSNSFEFNRLRRMITADLFVFGLGKLFAMSLFNSSIPPPFSYASDLSQFFFGNSKERHNAFFGVLPYPANIIGIGAPPISRIPFNIFTSLVTGDMDSLIGKITSWLPAGRFGKSIYQTIENPVLGIQSFTGLPIYKYTELKKQANKKKDKLLQTLEDNLLK